jgi:hypothetical protein
MNLSGNDLLSPSPSPPVEERGTVGASRGEGDLRNSRWWTIYRLFFLPGADAVSYGFAANTFMSLGLISMASLNVLLR